MCVCVCVFSGACNERTRRFSQKLSQIEPLWAHTTQRGLCHGITRLRVLVSYQASTRQKPRVSTYLRIPFKRTKPQRCVPVLSSTTPPVREARNVSRGHRFQCNKRHAAAGRVFGLSFQRSSCPRATPSPILPWPCRTLPRRRTSSWCARTRSCCDVWRQSRETPEVACSRQCRLWTGRGVIRRDQRGRRP